MMAKARIWGFGTQASAAPEPLNGVAGRGGDPQEALLLMKNFEDSCHGWFWSTDPEGHLTYISDGTRTRWATTRRP